jgi:hypothetical protein
MSKIAVAGNASGTGVFTIASPNSNTDRTLTLPDSTGTVLNDASSLAAANLTGTIAKARLPAGSVLQVVHQTKTSTFTGTSVVDNGGYFIDVTGLSATITPTSSSSKILIMSTLYIGTTTASSGYQHTYRLKRTIGGTTTFPILGDAEGGRPQATGRINMYGTNTYFMGLQGGTHQDSPATTSAITYQVQLGGYSSSPIVYLNRSETFQNSAGNYDNVPVSTLTLMEIAA